MDEFEEILQDFLIEAFELIEQLDQDLVELETRPEDLELLNRIFRVAHTIKGASSFLNFDILTQLTHHMENLLNMARHGDLIIDSNVMDVILESIDLMKALLVRIRDSGLDTGLEVLECVERLDAVANGEVTEPVAVVDEPIAAVEEILSDEMDYSQMSDEEVEAEIERLLAEKQAEAAAKRSSKQVVSAPPVVAHIPQPKPVAAAPRKSEPKEEGESKSSGTVEQTIRVDVKRLDHLMNLIGELVLGKNRLIKINDDVEERYEGEAFLEELNQVVSIVSLVTTDLQIAVMKTRMLPIGKVFNKFPRMIRDLSRELNKKIELEIAGEDTELDKSIVEEIGDPLVHIIRNSCDHGIETPDIRLAAGKEETGTIHLKAYHEGNHI
ncbi:MAG: chemotaxis protein CheA, partial [Sulfuricurvum sp.]